MYDKKTTEKDLEATLQLPESYHQLHHRRIFVNKSGQASVILSTAQTEAAQSQNNVEYAGHSIN
jgi:hypothetical protein